MTTRHNTFVGFDSFRFVRLRWDCRQHYKHTLVMCVCASTLRDCLNDVGKLCGVQKESNSGNLFLLRLLSRSLDVVDFRMTLNLIIVQNSLRVSAR